MTNPNSNRPILSLKPKVVIQPAVEVIAAINPCAKAKKVTNASIIRKLIKLFPLAFFGAKEKKLPLAYGIREQLFADETGFSRKTIRKAIYWYTSRLSYHKGVIDNERRINLDGSVASDVTADDKAYAADRIAAIEEAKALHDTEIQPIDLCSG